LFELPGWPTPAPCFGEPCPAALAPCWLVFWPVADEAVGLLPIVNSLARPEGLGRLVVVTLVALDELFPPELPGVLPPA